jgi:hypothetical protein
VPEALRVSGVGRTMLYSLIAKNEIESLTIGKRRLIVFASLKARLTSGGTPAKARP